jgi:hypothetical protein
VHKTFKAGDRVVVLGTFRATVVRAWQKGFVQILADGGTGILETFHVDVVEPLNGLDRLVEEVNSPAVSGPES